jgi:opacity protein-like surface antigen
MRPRAVVVVAGLLAVLLPTIASSQPHWGLTAYAGVCPWVGTGFLDLDDASDTTTPVFGVAVERALKGPFAVEGDLQWLPGFLDRSGLDSLLTHSRLVVASGNLVGRMRVGNRLVPRAALGIAAVHFSARDRLSAFDHDSTLLGVTVSGGVMVRIKGNVSGRVDARYLRTQRDATLGVFDDAYVDLAQVTFGVNFEW